MTMERPGWTRRLAVVATSFRRVGFGRLGGFVLGPEASAERRALADALGAGELVYLATCNRVECYAVLPDDAAGQEQRLLRAIEAFFAARGANVIPDETFFVRTGRGAVDHLFSVCASLDSLVVGETEISGQARRAVDRARGEDLCQKTLHRLFERAIACSRRVRAETAVGNTPVSVASIALQKIRKHFGKPGPGVTLVVGVGDMSKKVAQALAGSTGKRIVVNRTRAKAEAFCEQYGGVPMSLEELHQNPPGWVDLVFTATSSEDAVLTPADLAPALDARRRAGVQRPLIVVDLGLPRDVHHDVDAMDGALVVAMEHMEAISARNQQALEGEVEAARRIVDEEVALLLREDRFQCLAGESAERMLEKQLAHLSEADRQAILRFATGLAGRMARQPIDLAS